MQQTVTAEMSANVWKVLVDIGETVESGDEIVILESMKMEIPVFVESKGEILEIGVKEGDVVSEGDKIAVLKISD